MDELKIFVLVRPENMLFYGEIYTAGKNFTLPPALTALTNSTSGGMKPLGGFGGIVL